MKCYVSSISRWFHFERLWNVLHEFLEYSRYLKCTSWSLNHFSWNHFSSRKQACVSSARFYVRWNICFLWNSIYDRCRQTTHHYHQCYRIIISRLIFKKSIDFLEHFCNKLISLLTIKSKILSWDVHLTIQVLLVVVHSNPFIHQ